MTEVRRKPVPAPVFLTPPSGEKRAPAPLTEAEAIEIWIARWLRIRRADLVRRYNCDPRRLYEIWEGVRHPAARRKAQAIFAERYPGLVDRTDFGNHRRIPRSADPAQLPLFE